MPYLSRLVISAVRNIQQAEILLSPGFNLFYGDNGSGKTSILEAVHLLGLGRSFRTHPTRSLIKDGDYEATVFAETVEGLKLGVQKPIRGPQVVHIAGRKPESLAELSRSLPVQLINNESFTILEGSPQERRRFLDWGVFHVEHSFVSHWRRVKLALQNRNHLLKQGRPDVELEPWTREIASSGAHLDRYRRAYLGDLGHVITPYLGSLVDVGSMDSVSMEYLSGWKSGSDLYTQLQNELDRDRRYGHTGIGPHRADIAFRVGPFDAAAVPSRGQLKLLICALKIAQARLLLERTNQHCVFLIDDLPAELDLVNQSKICLALAEPASQVLMTRIEKTSLTSVLAESCLGGGGSRPRLFHAKHGSIGEIV